MLFATNLLTLLALLYYEYLYRPLSQLQSQLVSHSTAYVSCIILQSLSKVGVGRGSPTIANVAMPAAAAAAAAATTTTTTTTTTQSQNAARLDYTLGQRPRIWKHQEPRRYESSPCRGDTTAFFSAES